MWYAGQVLKIYTPQSPNGNIDTWAIIYEQLLDVRDLAKNMFNEDFELKTMRDINKVIIEPVCKQKKTSYVLSKIFID